MKSINTKYSSWIGCFLCLILTPSFAVINWPTGPFPCNNINDLESCLNGVPNGETIEIRANAIPSQSGISVSPAKSITLRAAPGFTPVFASFTSLFFLGSDDDITVVVEGLTIEIGNFSVRQGGSGTFNVTFRNNTVLNSSFRDAIQVSTGNTNPPYGPVIFLIENNILNVEDEVVSGISVGSFLGTGNQGLITNNQIISTDTGQAAAIAVFSSSNSSFNVDVIGNEISGQDFNSGISLRLFGSGGFLNARVINNVISGQEGNVGAPAAISISNSSSGFGHTNFEVINNTVAFNERGVLYNVRDDLGATSNITFMNNIVAFNSLFGINVDANPFTVNDYNLFFDNGGYPYIPEVNDIEQDPLFVSITDLRLQLVSPALNTGLNSAIPNDIVVDIDAETRIHQTVDMGAYESSITTDIIFKNSFQ